LAQPYQDASRSVDERVEDLLDRMTLEEKVGQLIQLSAHTDDEGLYEQYMRDGRVGSYLNVAFNWVHVSESGVYQENPNGTLTNGAARMNRLQRLAVEESRLAIPCLFAHDVVHGFRTIFPVPLGMACSWNPDTVEKASRVAAVEASSLGLRWTFAPMIDVTRDPRWGRIVEGGGEDPYLNGVLAAAAVRGFQTDDLSRPDAVLATPKHFVAYGAAEGGRDYAAADVSERTLREVYLPPFKTAFAAGAGATMVAFNEISGIPATAHPWTLQTILRGEWGFDGPVLSDWGSVGEMLSHGYAETLADAAALAINAGVDMDMESGAYRHLPELIGEGRVSQATLDSAVRRMLAAKFKLGLFDRPYVDESLAAEVLHAPEHQQAAREVARQSIVLLKNEGDLLPLTRGPVSIAVVGTLADDPKAQMGSWVAAGATGDSITMLEGIRRAAGNDTKVLYAPGAQPDTTDTSGITSAVDMARKADVVVAVLGELASMSGEARSRATLDLPGAQQELLEALQATGKPVVLVLMSGRPLTIPWAADHIPAILQAWFGGSQAGSALADVLFGDFNPCGRLPLTWPRAVGQIPLYYNHKNTGRPHVSRYEDIDNSPLFPFGFGLSYTTFKYENLAVRPASIAPDETLQISVRLTNTGERHGTEVVQLYLRDVVASVTRPVQELKAFEVVNLGPAESCIVTFSLGASDLAIFDAGYRRVVEPGRFEVFVGPDSRAALKGEFTVKERRQLAERAVKGSDAPPLQ
jgi:beta-glucosidase